MLRALFIDFNSYFASVEQQERPELRGRPVAVVPMLTDSTSCIAASYEAKAFGVKTGTNVALARQLCPGIELVESRTRTYVEYHHRLVQAVESCIHVEKVFSIDEMVCELTGRWREREAAIELAGRIKRTIAQQAGECLRASIGIAPNRFLAKTASDMQKPDGLVVVERRDLPQILHRLEPRDFAGIGPRMERRLHAHGIYTTEQLCGASREALREVWGGIEGERMHDELRGEVVLRAATERGTVGHSHVLAPKLRQEAGARAVAHRLLQKAAARMRKLGFAAQGLSVSLRYVGGSKWGSDARLAATQDTLVLERALEELWSRRRQIDADPLSVGVTLSDLVEEGHYTPPLFEVEHRSARLARAVDELNAELGVRAAYFAGAHEALGSAPPRIAFQSIPEVRGAKLPEEFRESYVVRDEEGS